MDLMPYAALYNTLAKRINKSAEDLKKGVDEIRNKQKEWEGQLKQSKDFVALQLGE